VIPGLDSKERLLKFFEAKGHLNLVLRVVDMLDMRITSLDYLLHQVSRMVQANVADGMEQTDGWRKRWLLHQFPSGWVVIPIKAVLEPMDLAECEKLQQALHEYRAVRMEKGEPHTIRPCEKCLGRQSGRVCGYCGGEGQTITFEEMSEWETTAARTPISP
jgi:hypothetical protein